jgi:hypothetical protein
MSRRQDLSRFLGSATWIYIMRLGSQHRPA